MPTNQQSTKKYQYNEYKQKKKLKKSSLKYSSSI